MRAIFLSALLVALPAAAGGHFGGGGFHGSFHAGGGGGWGGGFHGGGGGHWGGGGGWARSPGLINRGHGFFHHRVNGWGGYYPYYYAPYLYAPWDGYYEPTPQYSVDPPAPAVQPAPQEAPPPQPQMYEPPVPAPAAVQQAQAERTAPQSMGSRDDLVKDTTPGPDVWHWVDDEGVDNYSTSVPPEMRNRATKVGARLSGVVWTNAPKAKSH